ncbi:uncharacterized protein [Dysidea avara]|uniref:uncharacterized protein n=1 Tax=Dysidea avara TaxID=196820 RepID=UPI00332C1D39
MTEAESILSELKKTNTSINALAQKMKKTEKRMQRVEKRVKVSSSTPSSADDKCGLKQSSIPAGIRREIRRIYKLLLEEDLENFPGWKIEPGITYKDRQNQGVLDRLIREVKALNPVYLTEHIKGAAYRFYRSKTEEESIKRREKDIEKNVKKRRYERLTRKLQDRKASFTKATFNDEAERKEWERVLTLDLMSSDESDFNDNAVEILVTHQIPWLSEIVNSFKQTL